jgi:hypothetical protein
MRIKQRPVKHKADDGGGFTFDEKTFGIGDESLAISLMRDKMYAYPIRTSCQEILSNARDAHREVDKEQVPIEVTLPTEDDMFFRVRDFGPGMTPEQMDEVYRWYGRSSKRHTDDQTGGWGLGAKSPWAYTPWFDIVSITYDEDEECRMRRHYHSYIDKTDKGRLALKDESPTDEEIGVEVIIPVAETRDIADFDKAVCNITGYWKYIGGVRPTIKNMRSLWSNVKDILLNEGMNWLLLDPAARRQWGTRKPMAIVDGIPYAINIDALQINVGERHAGENHNDIIRQLSNCPVRLFFSTGEVNLIASREALNYDEETIDIVLFRFNNFLDELNSQLQEQLKDDENLWEALVHYSNIHNKYNMLVGLRTQLPQPLHWNGENLYSGAIGCSFLPVYYTVYTPGGKSLFYSKKHNDVKPMNVPLCIDDTGKSRPSRGRLYTLFQKTGHQSAWVILAPNEEELKRLKEKTRIEKMDPIYLSTIPKTRLPRKKAKKVNGRKVTVSKANEFIPATYRWSPEDIDINGNGYYVTRYYKELRYRHDTAYPRVIETALASFVRKHQLTVYSVTPSLRKRLGTGWKPIIELMKKKYDEFLADNNFCYWLAESTALQRGKKLPYGLTKWAAAFERSFGDEHLLRRYLAHLEAIVQQQKQIKDFMHLAREIAENAVVEGKDPKETDVCKLSQEIQSRYPLLAVCGACYVTPDAIEADVIKYIRLVDNGTI